MHHGEFHKHLCMMHLHTIYVCVMHLCDVPSLYNEHWLIGKAVHDPPGDGSLDKPVPAQPVCQ